MAFIEGLDFELGTLRRRVHFSNDTVVDLTQTEMDALIAYSFAAKSPKEVAMLMSTFFRVRQMAKSTNPEETFRKLHPNLTNQMEAPFLGPNMHKNDKYLSGKAIVALYRLRQTIRKASEGKVNMPLIGSPEWKKLFKDKIGNPQRTLLR